MNERKRLNFTSYLKCSQVLKSRENYQVREEIVEWTRSFILGQSRVYREIKQVVWSCYRNQES